MTDGQPIPTDPQGNKTNTPVSNPQEPVSLYDKTEAIVTRQEEANKKTEELLERQETLHANQRLAGTSGGNVEVKTKEETPKEYSDRVMKGELKDDKK